MEFQSARYNDGKGFDDIKEVPYADIVLLVAWVRSNYEDDDVLHELLLAHKEIRQSEHETVMEYIRKRKESRTILELYRTQFDPFMDKSEFVDGQLPFLKKEVKKEPGWYSLKLDQLEALVKSHERATRFHLGHLP